MKDSRDMNKTVEVPATSIGRGSLFFFVWFSYGQTYWPSSPPLSLSLYQSINLSFLSFFFAKWPAAL